MFIGEFKHAIDDKSRLAVPVKFRAALADGAVVTRGLDNCLFLYPKAEWEKLAEKFANLPLAQANTRAFTRLMLAGAMEVPLDKQGRVLLPDYLKEFAGLKKNAVLAGLYNRLEIWDETVWAKYKKQTEESSGDIAEKLAELGV
jgi:MraZ protein